MDYILQTEAKMLAAQSRELRKQEVKLRDKRRNSKSLSNQDFLNEAREEAYKVRQCVRTEARYLHLVRAYLSGHDYHEIEGSVRDGNKIDIFYLLSYFEAYGYHNLTTEDEITAWIEGC